MGDPLDGLIVDETAVPDNSILFGILKNKILLGKTGSILLSDEFHRLSHPKKILVYLLGRKAAVIKSLLNEKESVMPSKIGSEIMLDSKIVSARLADELKGVVKREKEGYFIPNFNILKCKSLMNEEKGGEK